MRDVVVVHGTYHYCQYINVDSVRPSITDVTQHDAVVFPFRGSNCVLAMSTARVHLRSVQLALSISDPLTQTNTNAKQKPLQFVAHLCSLGLLSATLHSI